MLPCLPLSTIKYGSWVKWSNPGKGVALSPIPQCSSYWKGSLLVALGYGRHLYLLFLVLLTIFHLHDLKMKTLSSLPIYESPHHTYQFTGPHSIILSNSHIITPLQLPIHTSPIIPTLTLTHQFHVRVNLGVMAIKGYSTFPEALHYWSLTISLTHYPDQFTHLHLIAFHANAKKFLVEFFYPNKFSAKLDDFYISA